MANFHLSIDGRARVAAIADRLALSPETVRRRLLRMELAGLCEKAGHGWGISAAGLRALRVEEAMTQNTAHLRHLFANLSRFGVLDDWASASSAARA